MNCAIAGDSADPPAVCSRDDDAEEGADESDEEDEEEENGEKVRLVLGAVGAACCCWSRRCVSSTLGIGRRLL